MHRYPIITHHYPSLPIAYGCMVSLIKIDGVKTLLFCPGLFELSSYVANFQFGELDQLQLPVSWDSPRLSCWSTVSLTVCIVHAMGLPVAKLLVDCKPYGLYRSRHGSARG